MKNTLEFLLLLLVLLGVLSICSCEKEELIPDVCTGGCDVLFNLGYPLDENGYYHVDLDFTKQHYPRFNVELDASITNPMWWYNNRPVVAAKFETDTYWQFQNDYLPVVQGTTVYFEKYNESRAYTKRIVGPIPPEMVGDTIEINPTVMWDAGNAYVKRTFSIKFIVE